MGLKNPIGRALAEKYIYLKCPESEKKIAELEALLRAERAKPPREVEREVIKTVLKDEGLLEKLNAAHKEMALLRGQLSRPYVPMREIKEPEPKEVIRTVELVRIKRVIDRRLLAAVSVASLLAGLGIGLLF